MNHNDRFQYGNKPDLTSSAFLRSSSSYTEFLQRQNNPEPPRNAFGNSPKIIQNGNNNQTTTWRKEPYNPPLNVFPPMTQNTMQTNGQTAYPQKTETTWRPQPQSSNTESWVNRNNYVEPPPRRPIEPLRPKLLPQKLVEPLPPLQSLLPLRSLPPVPPQPFLKLFLMPPTAPLAFQTPPNMIEPRKNEIWQKNQSSNWRKETAITDPIHQRAPEQRKEPIGFSRRIEPFDPNHRLFKEPIRIEEKLVAKKNDSSSAPPERESALIPTGPQAPEKQWDPPHRIAASPIIPCNNDVPEDPIGRIHSPIRNVILPEVESQPTQYFKKRKDHRPVQARVYKKEELTSLSKPSSLDQSRDNKLCIEKPHWNQKTTWEDSWMVQYKKRIEAQKADALLRAIDQKTSKQFPGPSHEPPIRYHERPTNERFGHFENKMPSEPISSHSFSERTSSGASYATKNRPFSGAPYKAPSNNIIDKIAEYHYVSIEPSSRESSHNDGRFISPSVSSTQYTDPKEFPCPAINPNDYDEEFGEEDWDALGALVNVNSRKRSRSPESSIPNKRPCPPHTESEYSSPMCKMNSIACREVSFFRSEKPSVKSLVAFTNAEYIKNSSAHNNETANSSTERRDPSNRLSYEYASSQPPNKPTGSHHNYGYR